MLELNKIYCMDAIEGMKQIPDGTIDLIATDPPYKLTSRGSSGTMSGYWATDIARKGRVFEHNDIEIEQYLPEFYRILKPDAHCYIMCNNLNLPHFFEVISKSEFNFVKLLVWDKKTKICGRYYMGQIEHIFMLRKGKDKPINNCGTSDLLSFANKRDKKNDGNNIHDSQKPTGLMATLINNSCNTDEIVLDPFMGSGTTAVAALQLGRKYIGFEISQEYVDIANERIKNETSQLSLF
jgi:site-specific DNA-methyltransferase (adenine-specific)